MRENKYDSPDFFGQYGKMDRSVKGLEGAGEWHLLKNMLPDFKDKAVLDIGCGYGWHCRYAMESGAISVVGTDISTKMLNKASKINCLPGIRYINSPAEDLTFADSSFDIVLSVLAIHYIESFKQLVINIKKWLRTGGHFVFTVEHPVFTAAGPQQWHTDENGNILHWPVDNYFAEGERQAQFLGHNVKKHHRTLTTYINTLVQEGFIIENLQEPQPSEEILGCSDEMKNELRRPMMLMICARKQ